MPARSPASASRVPRASSSASCRYGMSGATAARRPATLGDRPVGAAQLALGRLEVGDRALGQRPRGDRRPPAGRGWTGRAAARSALSSRCRRMIASNARTRARSRRVGDRVRVGGQLVHGGLAAQAPVRRPCRARSASAPAARRRWPGRRPTSRTASASSGWSPNIRIGGEQLGGVEAAAGVERGAGQPGGQRHVEPGERLRGRRRAAAPGPAPCPSRAATRPPAAGRRGGARRPSRPGRRAGPSAGGCG